MESNKLIAEFMGGILSSVPNLINLPQTIGESRILCVKGSEGLPNGTYEVKRITDLKYHSSWDWLMPVVGKISRDEKFIENEYREYLLDIVPYGRIQDVFEAVVQFIKKTEYKTCDKCCYDIVDDDGDVMEHICIDDREEHLQTIYDKKHDLVLKSIMTRYGGLTNLICQLREDSDVAYVNIADDTDMVVNEHEVEDIINQMIS